MRLLYPDFLFALFFLAIPIIIHLFNFRRYKTVKFSQVRFLKNIKQETQSTSKLKHLLVLASRILAITALVLAFCQPFIPNSENEINKGKRGVNIYLDNSFSMQVNDETGSLLNIAKSKALAVLDAYKETDKFRILTNDFKTHHSRWLNKKEFIIELQNIDFSPRFKTISQVMNRMKQHHTSEDIYQEYFIISDLQKTQFDIDNIRDTISIRLLPIQAEIKNNFNLSSLSFSQPFHLNEQEEHLAYTIKNHSKTVEDNLPLKLYLNEELKSPKFVSIPAKDSSNGELLYRSISSSTIKGKLTLKDYPLTFDDTLYFNYNIQKNINVIHIYNETPNANLKALFESDSLFNYRIQAVNGLDYSLISAPSLVIVEGLKEISSGLHSALVNFVNGGGSLSFFPSKDLAAKQFNELLNALNIGQAKAYEKKKLRINRINRNCELFESVFENYDEKINLPDVEYKWNIDFYVKALKENIMSFSDNSPFLSMIKSGKGKVYLSVVGLSGSESNLVNHAIFVPLLFNMALQSSQQEALYYELDQTNIRISDSKLAKSTESPLHIVGYGQDFIPMQRFSGGELLIDLKDELTKAGHYTLTREGIDITTLSFNYNRRESHLDFFNVDELKSTIELLGHHVDVINDSNEVLIQTISQLYNGTILWKYFIILALIFIALEIILLRVL